MVANLRRQGRVLVLFVAGKLKFIDANGKPGNSPAQGTTLFAVGEQGRKALSGMR